MRLQHFARERFCSGVSQYRYGHRHRRLGVRVDSAESGLVDHVQHGSIGDGSVIGDVQPTVLAELTKGLGIEPPYAARAVRQNETEWIVGALRIESELVELPAGVAALTLEVAVPPEGETMYLVDGDVLAEPPEGVEAEALDRLADLGAARFQAFAARADRLEDGRWELTVDPL